MLKAWLIILVAKELRNLIVVSPGVFLKQGSFHLQPGPSEFDDLAAPTMTEPWYRNQSGGSWSDTRLTIGCDGVSELDQPRGLGTTGSLTHSKECKKDS